MAKAPPASFHWPRLPCTKAKPNNRTAFSNRLWAACYRAAFQPVFYSRLSLPALKRAHLDFRHTAQFPGKDFRFAFKAVADIDADDKAKKTFHGKAVDAITDIGQLTGKYFRRIGPVQIIFQYH